jgi:orotate phosphoribosyltransferase
MAQLTDKQVYNVFKKCGGLLNGHFLLTSGRHSDRYMQCAKLFVDPKNSERLVRALAEKLADTEIDLVAAPAVGGIIMGYALARQIKCGNIFAERTDGRMEFRRGFSVPTDARVLVVEDVVTTGGSVREVIEIVRAGGGRVVGVASIVDRSNGGVDFGVPYTALLSMEIPSYDAAECPICKKKNGAPLVKPGSRK